MVLISPESPDTSALLRLIPKTRYLSTISRNYGPWKTAHVNMDRPAYVTCHEESRLLRESQRVFCGWGYPTGKIQILVERLAAINHPSWCTGDLWEKQRSLGVGCLPQSGGIWTGLNTLVEQVHSGILIVPIQNGRIHRIQTTKGWSPKCVWCSSASDEHPFQLRLNLRLSGLSLEARGKRLLPCLHVIWSHFALLVTVMGVLSLKLDMSWVCYFLNQFNARWG